MATVLFSGEVWLSYSQVYLLSDAEPGDPAQCFAGQSNGLCGAAVAGMLHLRTGLHTGLEPFTVELHHQAPAHDEHDGWEEIVEASLHTDTTALRLYGCMAEQDHPIELERPGDYRARYSARGLDAAHAMDTRRAGEPAPDAYLLQLWPAPPAPDAIVRQSSPSAAYWHRDAHALPTPAEQAVARARADAAAREANLIRQQQLDLELNWGGREPSPRLRALGHIAHQLARTDRDLLDQLADLDPETQRDAARWLAHRAFHIADLDTLDLARAGLDALDAGRPLPRPFVDLTEAFALVYPAGTTATGGLAEAAGTLTATSAPLPGSAAAPPSAPGTGLLDLLRAELPAIPATTPVPVQPPTPAPQPATAVQPAAAAPGPLAPGLTASATAAPGRVHRPSMAIPALPAATADDPLHALLDTLGHAGAAYAEQRPQLIGELRARYLA